MLIRRKQHSNKIKRQNSTFSNNNESRVSKSDDRRIQKSGSYTSYTALICGNSMKCFYEMDLGNKVIMIGTVLLAFILHSIR